MRSDQFAWQIELLLFCKRMVGSKINVFWFLICSFQEYNLVLILLVNTYKNLKNPDSSHEVNQGPKISFNKEGSLREYPTKSREETEAVKTRAI